MKIEVEKLYNFLNKVTLNGSIPSATIKTTNKGMYVSLVNIDNSCMVKGLLLKKSFENYEEGLNITLGNTTNVSSIKLLLKILKSFTGKINLNVKDNNLIIDNDKKIVNLNLTDEEFINNNFNKELKLEFDKGFVLKKTIINQITKNINILNIASDVPSIKLKIQDNNLFIKSTIDLIEINEKEKIEYIDCEVSFDGKKFNEVLNIFDEDIEISIINKEKPVKIKEINEYMFINVILAPIIEN